MVKIAVIDDEEQILEQIYGYVEKGIDETEAVELCSFLSSKDFISRIKSGEQYDIVFSDIELGDGNGIEIGRTISEKYPQTYVVFITSHPEFAAESYAIEAYQYILKYDMERRLPRMVNRLIEKIERERLYYRWIGTETNREKIFYRDIIYISKVKSAKYVQYITKNGEYRERITLEQLMHELHSDEFILVERAYIVNINVSD